MTLDELYGSGASGELRAALQLPGRPGFSFLEVANPDGSVRVIARWGSAVLKIDCTADNVHYATLKSGSTEKTGLYTDLCAVLPALFRSWGVERFTCSVPPKSDWRQMHLGKVGAWQERDSSERLTWVL